MLVIIDNYDSFTYNLYQYFCQLGAKVEVRRNDAIDIAGIEQLQPSHIVISPGPCTPNEAGISVDVIRHFATQLPILGVCLGHQAIAQAFGGDVIRAKKVMHGKNSLIMHDNQSVFTGLANPLNVTRYHSLIVNKETLPENFKVTAWTQDDEGNMDEIMGIQHRSLPLHGVQFHPESVRSQQGLELLNNFLHFSL